MCTRTYTPETPDMQLDFFLALTVGWHLCGCKTAVRALTDTPVSRRGLISVDQCAVGVSQFWGKEHAKTGSTAYPGVVCTPRVGRSGLYVLFTRPLMIDPTTDHT